MAITFESVFAVSNRNQNDPSTPIVRATVQVDTDPHQKLLTITNRCGDVMNISADGVAPLIATLLEAHAHMFPQQSRVDSIRKIV